MHWILFFISNIPPKMRKVEISYDITQLAILDGTKNKRLESTRCEGYQRQMCHLNVPYLS